MIHFISSRDHISSSILTSLAFYRCLRPSAPSLAQASPLPPTCPSRLQPVHQAKFCLNLLHLDHMTQCHISYAMSSFIITCVSFATSPSHFHLHGICCSHTCTYGLITYVSHINTISPPRLSLNYQNQQGPFTHAFTFHVIIHCRHHHLKPTLHYPHHYGCLDLGDG